MHANKGATKPNKTAQGSQIALILFYLRGPLQPEPLLPSLALSHSLSLARAFYPSFAVALKDKEGPIRAFWPRQHSSLTTATKTDILGQD